jgi:diacylglycerol O-acyltransferase / wax synthase
VPGPPVPLYMAGARMVTNYPASIVVHGMALNITVQSYDQSLDFGLMADAAAMPDVRSLAEALHIAFDDLRALPRPGEHDPDAPPAEGLVSKTGKRIAGGVAGAVTSSLGKVTRSVMGSMMDAAVSQVTRRPRASDKPSKAVAPKKKARAG